MLFIEDLFRGRILFIEELFCFRYKIKWIYFNCIFKVVFSVGLV